MKVFLLKSQEFLTWKTLNKIISFFCRKRKKKKKSLQIFTGWFVFISISPSLSHIATRVCLCCTALFGSADKLFPPWCSQKCICYFFLNLFPFLLQMIFILMKKRRLSVPSVKSLYLVRIVRNGRVSFFPSKGFCFFFLTESICVCISLSKLGLMHLFTPHKPPNSDQVGTTFSPYLCRKCFKLRIQR